MGWNETLIHGSSTVRVSEATSVHLGTGMDGDSPEVLTVTAGPNGTEVATLVGDQWRLRGIDLAEDSSGRVRIASGNLSGSVPESSHTTFVFGGTTAQPHTLGERAYLSGIWGGYNAEIDDDAFACHICGSNHSTVNADVDGESYYGNHVVIAGGSNWTVTDSNYATIIGSTTDTAGSYGVFDSNLSTIVGAQNAKISGDSADPSTHTHNLIAGGHSHAIADCSRSAAIGGSSHNISDGNGAVAVGGALATIEGGATYDSDYSVIVGGYNNTITGGDYSSIVASYGSEMTGRYSFALGGRSLTVSGDGAGAIGRDATASANGAFIWTDYQTESALENSTANSLLMRMENGYRLTGGAVKPDLIDASELPTSDPGVAGQVYNDAGTLKVSAG